MTKKTNYIIKFGTAILSLVFFFSLFTISVGSKTNASAESIATEISGTEYVSTIAENATFASKNLLTDTVDYYNLYCDGEMVDLSEEAEEEALNSSDVTELVDEAYFPENGTVQPSSIIDTDDRTQVTTTTTHPYAAICHITITWPDSTTACGTAWMYYTDVAITAGHCVYSSDHGGWAQSIAVRPGANGSSSPYGTVYSTTLHTSTNWVNDANGEYDYGVIELSSDIGNSTGYFGSSWTIWSLKGTDVTITGYPGEYYRQMWTMSGSVSKSATRKVYYTIDTSAGQSGSPVYNSSNQAIAIHAYGGSTNSGTRITKAIFNFIHSFREE